MTTVDIEYWLKHIHYLFEVRSIRKSMFDKEPCGWNACSSSVIRKPHTIERLQQEIKSKNLPLRIEENDDEFTLTRFQVYLTNKN